jgi:outer membrane protein, heavy metal efflux system
MLHVGPVRATKLWASLVLVLALCASSTALGAGRAQDLPTDATLSRLIEQALAALPELKSGEHLAQAQAARISRAGAWPDPFLQLGLQNDGFERIQVGKMETSFVSLMASQTIPWPGKTRLRESIAALDAEGARWSLSRMRLSVEAFVRVGYLDLMWVRERRALFEQRATLWQRALDAALSRYEAGTGAQVDALRARLELLRLEQQRALLDMEEQTSVRALNRARQRDLDEPITTGRTVGALPPPASYIDVFAPDRAVAGSPELAAARAQVALAGRQVELSQKSYAPDVTVGAGFMYRGALPPMWLVTVGAPIPVFAGSKQGAAVREGRALEHASRERARMLEQLVRLRSAERRGVFEAVVKTIEVYEQGLLAQSATTAEAALTQYRVGKGTFASVLEANAGLIADREGHLSARVQAERLLIAEREISLEPTALPAAASGGSAMPGAMSGASASPRGAVPSPPSSGSDAATTAPSGGSMSSM